MKYFVALLLLSVAMTSWATYTGSAYDTGYGYGYGLAATVHFQPSYSTSKPVYESSWKPIVGYKPYKGPGSAGSYGYGYKPAYSTYKPVYVYKPYYAGDYPSYPYYGYGSLHGYNPYYYGSYKQGLGYGHGYDYTDWSRV